MTEEAYRITVPAEELLLLRNQAEQVADEVWDAAAAEAESPKLEISRRPIPLIEALDRSFPLPVDECEMGEYETGSFRLSNKFAGGPATEVRKRLVHSLSEMAERHTTLFEKRSTAIADHEAAMRLRTEPPKILKPLTDSDDPNRWMEQSVDSRTEAYLFAYTMSAGLNRITARHPTGPQYSLICYLEELADNVAFHLRDGQLPMEVDRIERDRRTLDFEVHPRDLPGLSSRSTPGDLPTRSETKRRGLPTRDARQPDRGRSPLKIGKR